MNGRTRSASRHAEALSLVQRPEGVTVNAMRAALDVDAHQAGNLLFMLGRQGKAFGAAWPEASSPRVYFGSAREADAYLAAKGGVLPTSRQMALALLKSLGGEPITLASFAAHMAKLGRRDGGALDKLLAAGEAVSVQVVRRRYVFLTRADADRWVRIHGAQARAKERKALGEWASSGVKARRGQNSCVPTKPGVPAGVDVRRSEEPQEVDLNGVVPKVIASPTHDDRYQLAPGTRVVGGFATMGIGRYL